MPSLDAKPVKKTFLADDGLQIVGEVRGQGDAALVFLHGWCGDREYWKHQVGVFSADYRVVAIDQAGHGESGKDLKAWTANISGSVSTQRNKECAMRKSYWFLGHHQTIIAGPADTEGRYDLVEGWFPAGTQIPPHRHQRYSEHFYVLEGELTVWAGQRRVVLRPGDDLLISPGTAHAFRVTGDGPWRALAVASPSSFARLVAEVGTPDDGSGVPPSAVTDMDLLQRVSAELGDEILGPPGAMPE